MRLSIQKNTMSGYFELTPLAGRFAGKTVALAESVTLRDGTEEACSLKSVWGLTVLNDRVTEDAETIQSLLGRRR